MGYDVTFHPVAVSELQHFVFDVAGDGKLAKSRAKELAKSEKKQKEIADNLGRLPGFVESVKEEGDFANSIAFVAAVVAGYLHPFWYARGSALSRLAIRKSEVTRFFTSLTEVAKGVVGKLDDDSGGIFGSNYTASGIILPETLPALSAALEKMAQPISETKPGPLFDGFDDNGYDALKRAIAYATEHGLGLIEATDVVVPLTNEGFTNLDNMRAHFLKNVDYGKPGKSPARKKRTAAKSKTKKKAAAKPRVKPKAKAKMRTK